MSDDVVLRYLQRLRELTDSPRLLADIDAVESERLDELASPHCARCGKIAVGYATINHKRYCHSDARSCYSQAQYENHVHRLQRGEWPC